MRAGDWAGFHPEALDGFADQEARAFIKTDLGIPLIKGHRIQMKDPFHARDKLSVHRPDTPYLLQVRLEVVFFASTGICVGTNPAFRSRTGLQPCNSQSS